MFTKKVNGYTELDPVGIAKGVAGLIVFLWLTSSFVIVSAGSVGIVTQFGKITGREMTPGFNLKAPWPINGVEVFSTQIQKEEADASASSSDLQQVTAKVAVNYHLEQGQVSSIYQNIGIEYKGRIIDPAIQESAKSATAKYNAADLITNRQSVKDLIDSTLVARLKPYGIIVDAVSITNFDFSEQFNQAIEAKQVAQQKAEQAQYSLEQAQKDAQAQEAQKVSLTPEILQKMAIEKWNGVMPQYMGSGTVFNVPLTK